VNVTVPVAACILDFGPYVAAVHVPDANREGPAGPAAGRVGDRVGRDLIQLLDLYRVEEPRRGALLALLREA
jgi:hypothetical protein